PLRVPTGRPCYHADDASARQGWLPKGPRGQDAALNFTEKLRSAQGINNSFLCIGLDPDPELMAHPHIPSFLQEIIDATSDLVCAYKPNLAFFEALGLEGMQTMLESLRSIPRHIPIIADAKRGDIGNTTRFYAKA